MRIVDGVLSCFSDTKHGTACKWRIALRGGAATADDDNFRLRWQRDASFHFSCADRRHYDVWRSVLERSSMWELENLYTPRSGPEARPHGVAEVSAECQRCRMVVKLHMHPLGDASATARVRGGYELGRAKHCPYLAHAVDINEEERRLITVYELLRGNVRGLLSARDPLSEGVTYTVVYQVLRGVQHLHHMGVAHCNVTADAVRFARDEHIYVKLADFYYAVALEDGRHVEASRLNAVFWAKHVETSVDARQFDVYAVGFLALEMLTATSVSGRGVASCMKTLDKHVSAECSRSSNSFQVTGITLVAPLSQVTVRSSVFFIVPLFRFGRH